MNGFLLIDKPEGLTSHGVVGRVRRITGIRRVGHTGTLDPMATGLLPICIGHATRMSEYMLADDKTYQGQLILGYTSDTYDRTGVCTKKADSSVDEKTLKAVFASMTGKQLQLPPMYSAKKVGGKKLYELAREGKEIERKPSPIEIYSLELLSFAEQEATFSAAVSKGTYIRSLVHDIGEKLGCGAVLSALRRIRSGAFSIEQSLTLEQIEQMSADELRPHLLPADYAIADAPALITDEDIGRRLTQGQRIATKESNAPLLRVYGKQGFLGPGAIQDGVLKLMKVLENKE